jgi:hypothetical protein
MSNEQIIQGRQFVINYKRGVNGKMGQLEPNVHAAIYTRPEVLLAAAFIQAQSFVQSIVIQLDDELFILTARPEDKDWPHVFSPSDLLPSTVVESTSVTTNDAPVSGGM